MLRWWQESQETATRNQKWSPYSPLTLPPMGTNQYLNKTRLTGSLQWTRLQMVSDFTSKWENSIRAGNVAEWETICLACTKPWVQIPNTAKQTMQWNININTMNSYWSTLPFQRSASCVRTSEVRLRDTQLSHSSHFFSEAHMEIAVRLHRSLFTVGPCSFQIVQLCFAYFLLTLTSTNCRLSPGL